MDFDSFLNFIIPWIIGIAGIWLMYKPLAPALSGFVSFIKNTLSPLFDMFRDKTEDIELNGPKEIYYE